MQHLDDHLLLTAPTLYPDAMDGNSNSTTQDAIRLQAWLQEHQIETIPWPTASPDLSPIENIWGLMKIEVEQMAP